MQVLYPVQIGIWRCFCGRRKTGEPGEKPLEQGGEPTTNSTHSWHWVESNLGHIGGGQVLSPVYHSRSPRILMMSAMQPARFFFFSAQSLMHNLWR